MWQDPAKPVVAPQGGSPYVLHFYAAVGKDFKTSLIFTKPTPPLGTKQHRSEENFTKEHFIKEVMPKLQQQIEGHYGHNYKVILDGATQHTAHKSQDDMEMAGSKLVDDFPRQSWDINIIEFCWGMLMECMQKRRPRNLRGWRCAAAGVGQDRSG